MICTSYFASKLIRQKDFRLVSIALSTRYVKCERYKALAPTREMIELAHAGNTEEYTRLYRSNVLAKLNPQKVYEELDGTVLLCWEKSGSFCHRRLVADWLEKSVGQPVPELEADWLTEYELLVSLKKAKQVWGR